MLEKRKEEERKGQCRSRSLPLGRRVSFRLPSNDIGLLLRSPLGPRSLLCDLFLSPPSLNYLPLILSHLDREPAGSRLGRHGAGGEGGVSASEGGRDR